MRRRLSSPYTRPNTQHIRSHAAQARTHTGTHTRQHITCETHGASTMASAMSYGEAVAIVTMPHMPCTFENVISVAESSRQLSTDDVENLEALVDAIHDLQIAAGHVDNSDELLSRLSKTVGIEDITCVAVLACNCFGLPPLQLFRIELRRHYSVPPALTDE